MKINIRARIEEGLNSTEWGSYHPYHDPAARTLGDIAAVCNDNVPCILDYGIHNTMDKNEVMNYVYQFITHRAHIVRDGLQNNLIPHHHLDFGGIFDLIDWHFILDCIGVFL